MIHSTADDAGFEKRQDCQNEQALTRVHAHVPQVVVILALAVSRALNVWPNAALVNYVRPPDLRIPQSQQFMMWFSGMRGAMAFAMVLRALEDLPGAL